MIRSHSLTVLSRSVEKCRLVAGRHVHFYLSPVLPHKPRWIAYKSFPLSLVTISSVCSHHTNMPSAAMLVTFAALATLAASARRPARCLGGANRLTVCVETPPERYDIQPRRYDNGGLYGPEFFRRRYDSAGAVLAPPPDYAVRYGGYGVQTKPLYGPASPVYRPGVIRPPVIRPVVYRPAPNVIRPIQPVFRPIQPVIRPVPASVFRPSPPIAVDYGLQRRSGYAVPSVYGGRADYAGGFQPVAVAPRPYPVAPQPQPRPAQARPFIIRPHVTGPQ